MVRGLIRTSCRRVDAHCGRLGQRHRPGVGPRALECKCVYGPHRQGTAGTLALIYARIPRGRAREDALNMTERPIACDRGLQSLGVTRRDKSECQLHAAAGWDGPLCVTA